MLLSTSWLPRTDKSRFGVQFDKCTVWRIFFKPGAMSGAPGEEGRSVRVPIYDKATSPDDDQPVAWLAAWPKLIMSQNRSV
jgi:hypothetical protein